MAQRVMLMLVCVRIHERSTMILRSTQMGALGSVSHCSWGFRKHGALVAAHMHSTTTSATKARLPKIHSGHTRQASGKPRGNTAKLAQNAAGAGNGGDAGGNVGGAGSRGGMGGGTGGVGSAGGTGGEMGKCGGSCSGAGGGVGARMYVTRPV